MTRPRVVLVGAGHAHLEVLRRARRFERAGVDLVLIDPGGFCYSGAMTGVLSGALSLHDAVLDSAALAGPARLINEPVEQVDPQARRLRLRSGRRIAFDVLSLNTGSRIAAGPLLDAGAIAAKPWSNLLGLRDRVEQAGGRMRLIVVGAGATGVELALAFAGLQARLGAQPRVTLADRELMADWPPAARRAAARRLAEAGIVWEQAFAKRLTDGLLELEGGKLAPADAVIAATGLVANLPPGLTDAAEGLPVGPDLAWIDDPRIFAAGDCAELVEAPRPKLGVFGVRAAPVLTDNLIRTAVGDPASRRFHPQKRWLSLLDCGNERALGRYGGVAFQGRWALALKRRIDADFIARYRP